eukprot:gene8262-9710_t
MNAPRRSLELHTAEAVQVVLMAVDFRPHPPRVRRQQQDAVAHHQRISPSHGLIKPAMDFNSVDLPQPEGPSNTKRSAGSIAKLTW